MPFTPDMLELGSIGRAGCLATALLPLIAEAGEPPRRGYAVEVWVELADDVGLPAEVVSVLRGEVEAIYGTAGVAIEWLSEGPVEDPPHMARVYILEELPALLETRLGAFRSTRTIAVIFGRERGGGSGSIIYISRTAVCRNATAGAADALSHDPLGRALGRVVAHELAHRFIASEHSLGVLKPHFVSSELTATESGLEFTAQHIRRLRDVARPRGDGMSEASGRR